MTKAFLKNLIPPVAVAAMTLVPLAARAEVTMSATYFTIAENDQDMNSLASGVFNNEVQNALGPDGLPVLNTAAYGCVSNCFTNTPFPQDVVPTGPGAGEITWWSPTLNTDVTQTGTGTITLAYGNGNFYPPNGGGPNDYNGFQAAVFSTVLDVPSPESIDFTVGADDVAFVYLDGSVVCDLGGVHGDSPGDCTSATLTAGTHTLQLFYADLENSGAALTFDINTQDITGSATPEPASWMLFAAALAGFGVTRLRRAR